MPVNISTDPISDHGAFRLTMERLKMVPHDVIRGLSRTISLEASPRMHYVRFCVSAGHTKKIREKVYSSMKISVQLVPFDKSTSGS